MILLEDDLTMERNEKVDYDMILKFFYKYQVNHVEFLDFLNTKKKKSLLLINSNEKKREKKKKEVP